MKYDSGSRGCPASTAARAASSGKTPVRSSHQSVHGGSSPSSSASASSIASRPGGASRGLTAAQRQRGVDEHRRPHVDPRQQLRDGQAGVAVRHQHHRPLAGGRRHDVHQLDRCPDARVSTTRAVPAARRASRRRRGPGTRGTEQRARHQQQVGHGMHCPCVTASALAAHCAHDAAAERDPVRRVPHRAAPHPVPEPDHRQRRWSGRRSRRSSASTAARTSSTGARSPSRSRPTGRSTSASTSRATRSCRPRQRCCRPGEHPLAMTYATDYPTGRGTLSDGNGDQAGPGARRPPWTA